MGWMDFLIDPLGFVESNDRVKARQDDQWQCANSFLTEAVRLLGKPDGTLDDHVEALATAVTGLLALQLSRT